jgi:hypothetical protein
LAELLGNPYYAIGTIFLVSLVLFVVESLFTHGPISVVVRVAMLLLAPVAVAVICFWGL